MGSFNVSCGVSRLSIGAGDPAVLFPLVPSGNSEFEKLSSVTIVSNSGPFALFNCRTLPVIGRYDDYGGLEDIYENENTRIIEQNFNSEGNLVENDDERGSADIYQIVSAWTGYESGHPGMFVHGEVYKALSTTMVGEYASKDRSTLQGIFPVPPFMLERLGFVLEQTREEGRYTHLYGHPDSDGFRIASDGNFCHIEVEGKEIDGGLISSIKALAKQMKPFGVRLNTEGLDDISEYDWKFDQLQHKLIENDKKLQEALQASRQETLKDTLPAKLTEGYRDIMLRLYGPDDAIKAGFMDIGDYNQYNDDKSPLATMYADAIKSGAIKPNLVACKHFTTSMSYVNALFFLSYAGPQFGASHSTKFLGKLIQDISEVEIARHEDDEDEDEDDE